MRQVGACLLIGKSLPDGHDTVLVEVVCGQAGGVGLEKQPRGKQILHAGAYVLQVDDDGGGQGPGVRCPEHQTAVGSAAHLGQAVVLDKPDRFPDYFAAASITHPQIIL